MNQYHRDCCAEHRDAGNPKGCYLRPKDETTLRTEARSEANNKALVEYWSKKAAAEQGMIPYGSVPPYPMPIRHVGQ